MIKIPEVFDSVNLELAPLTNGSITDVGRLLRNLDYGLMYIEEPVLGASCLYIREKLLLLKHFSTRDSASYTDIEKTFIESKNAKELLEWGISQYRFYNSYS